MMARATGFTPEVESAETVQVERGLVFATALTDRINSIAAERLIELSTSPRLSDLIVSDRSSHRRPVYRALLVYTWLQSFKLLYEKLPREQFGRWEEGIRAWCDQLEMQLGGIEIPDGPIPASLGSDATEASWIALALHVAGKVFIRDAWTDLASDTFGRLTRHPAGNGALLHQGERDNPETHWYHELVVLHACGSYAVQAEDRVVAAVVKRATDFHFDDTQPDHATHQPWAVFPFVWNSRTRILADQLIHAATVQHVGTIDGVSLMLLADALYCIRLFP